jgi:hypothetical protein
MKYQVEIIETLATVIEVEAATDDDAYRMVKKAYRNSSIILTADNFIGVEFKVCGDDDGSTA